MFFLRDIKKFSKKEIKVKSYVRNGHLVKQSKRKIDIRDLVNKAGIGLGIGTGIGAAYLLGNRNGFNNSKKIINELENKLLKREPKIINRIINRVPKQDRHIGVEEIRDIIRSENQSLMGEVKQEINKINNKEIIKEQIKPVINSDEWVDEIIPVVKGTKLDVPKIDNLDELISNSYLKDVPNKNLDKLSIEELENNINKLDKEQKHIRSYLDKNDIADTLENLTNTVNKEVNSDKDWFNYQLKQIDELRKKLGKGKLTDKQIESGKLPTYNFYDNKEEYKKYYNKARKHSRDLFDAKDKLIKEIERRDKLINPDIISDGKSNEELSALLDDFNNSINMYTFSSPYFFSDINVNFSRNKGSKDKVKRMTRLGAYTRIGISGGLLVSPVGYGLGLIGTRSIKGGLIGAGLAGGLGAGASYLEHKNSKYSPIGKKKWKNYITDNPTYYGIPLNKLSRLIK